MTAEHDRETLDLLSWALSGRGDLSSKKLLDRVRAVMAARDEALAKVAEVETFAGVMAAYHRPDETRGGCICGFCAWSVEHVAIMSVRDAMDALAAGSSGALVVPAPRPAEEIRADLYRAATLIADGSDARDVLHMLAMDVEPLLSRLAAVERERDEARGLLSKLVDPDQCWFDHNGDCQAHGWTIRTPGGLCGHEQAKRLLIADAPVPPQPEPTTCRCDVIDAYLAAPSAASRAGCSFICPVHGDRSPEPEWCEHGQTEAHLFWSPGSSISGTYRCPGPMSPQSTEEQR